MYLTVHGVAGLAIARLTPNPIVAFIAGVLSHLALDLIPHGDEHLVDSTRFTRRRILKRIIGAGLVDSVVLAIMIMLYVATTPWVNAGTTIAALAGALLPDILHGVHMVTGSKYLDWFTKFHLRLHNLSGQKFRWQVGMLIQVLIFTALWLVVVA